METRRAARGEASGPSLFTGFEGGFERPEKKGGGGQRGEGGESQPGGHRRQPAHFSRAATRFRPSSSRRTRSRPWFASRPSRFILLISVETNERDAPTRSARSCWVIPCRQSSFPGAIRSPCACASAISISAR